MLLFHIFFEIGHDNIIIIVTSIIVYCHFSIRTIDFIHPIGKITHNTSHCCFYSNFLAIYFTLAKINKYLKYPKRGKTRLWDRVCDRLVELKSISEHEVLP